MRRMYLSVSLIVLAGIFTPLVHSGGPPSHPQDDPPAKPARPNPPANGHITTYGTIDNIFTYESGGEQYYFRLVKMPQGINWFKAKSNRSFAIVQQAAEKNWLVRVSHDDKGEVLFVKSIMSTAGGKDSGTSVELSADGDEDRETLFRKNVYYLPTNEVKNLREALKEVRASGEYDRQVRLHDDLAEHVNNRIWPWHRAYLYYFEKKLQAGLPHADPPVTIPYWNYDRTDVEFRKLPEHFRPETVDGKPNQLHHRRYDGWNEGTKSLSYDAVRTDRIITNISDFYRFSSALEHGPHDHVHRRIGSTMADINISPRDPIFWLHHANMDRVWDVWAHTGGHQNPTDPTWQNQPLRGFSAQPKNKVGQFLNISELDYTYVEQVVDVRLAAHADKESLTSSALDFKAAWENPGRRVTIEFTGVRVPEKDYFAASVFLHPSDEKAATDSPSFVGEFTLLAMKPQRHKGRATVVLDATDTIRAWDTRNKKTDLILTLMPVKPEEGTASIDAFKFQRARIIIHAN